MIPVSVVIIAKNEAHIIGETISSVAGITDDVIVVDSGSTDGTKNIIKAKGATLLEIIWEGFGPTKNKGIDATKYDWILSIDADEQPDAELLDALSHLDYSKPNVVYRVKFKTFLGKKLIRYGEWGNDSHIRIFNKKTIRWNNDEVHEQLKVPAHYQVQNIKGHILHYTMKDVAEFATKTTKYALLSAERYYKQGKKATWVKRNFAHRFSYINNYIFRLGFLDGREGHIIATMTTIYTYLKYARLHELHNKKQ